MAGAHGTAGKTGGGDQERFGAAKAGLAAETLAKSGNKTELGRVGLARFFAEKLATAAPGLGRAVASGAMPLEPYEAILAESA